MTLQEYQEAHRRTSSTYTAKDALTNGLMGLCGEAGECLDALKSTCIRATRWTRTRWSRSWATSCGISARRRTGWA